MTGVVEPQGELKPLTGLRGVAAWFVVLYHLRLSIGAQVPEPVMTVLSKGYLAVDLFFMLSGFVLWLTYARTLREGGLHAFPRFIARRIARIWPLHLFMLGVAVAFAFARILAGNPNHEHYNFAELPLHISMMHSWGFVEPLRWNDPSWSVSGEFAAYLMFPLLALAVDWRRFAPETLVMVVALLILLLHQIMLAGGATIMDHNMRALALPRALFQFAIGTVICALWLQWRSGRRGFHWILAPVLLAFLLFQLPKGQETVIAPTLAACLLLGMAITAEARVNPLGWRPIYYLGQISYSTYLVHFLLFVGFKIVFVDVAGPVPLPLLGLYLLMTLGASVLLYHGVEKPAQRVLNRWFDSRLQRRRAPAAT